MFAAACSSSSDDSSSEETAAETTAAAAETTAAPETTAAATETTAAEAASESACPDGPSGDPIVIGVIQALSGGASFYSAQAVKMLETAVAAANEGTFLDAAAALPTTDPGILCRPIELIFEDDQGDPNLTVARTRRLIERGADAVFFGSGSSSSVQGRVVCEEEQVFCMAPNNVSAAIVTPPNASFVFTLAPPSTETVKEFINIFTEQGYTTIAYNSDDTATGQFLKDSYKEAFEAAGFQTVADEVVPVGSTDISGQVLRIKDANPDVIFDMSQTATEGGLFFRTSARLAPGIPRYGTNAITSQPEMWEIAGAEGMNGVFVLDNLSPDNTYSQAVAEVYDAANPGAPFLFIHGMNWDAVMLLKAAIESAGTTDGPAVVAAFEQIANFPVAHGQAGYTLSFSPENHNGAGPKGHVVVVFNGTEVAVADGYQP